jgi:hypothetical protein
MTGMTKVQPESQRRTDGRTDEAFHSLEPPRKVDGRSDKSRRKYCPDIIGAFLYLFVHLSDPCSHLVLILSQAELEWSTAYNSVPFVGLQTEALL